MLEMINISKTYPGVKALNNVDLKVGRGEVHALLGENGAGKSTLMKILRGVISKNTGKIILEGREILRVPNRAEAARAGISMVFQELSLFPQLTITENLFLSESRGLFKWSKLNEISEEILARFNLRIDPRTKVGDLTVAEQQLVEIAKATKDGAKILILDEPTSALSDKEVEKLFQTIRNLKEEGMGIIFIGHRLNEVFELADNATVLRDGNFIGRVCLGDCCEDDIIEMMVGRRIENLFPHREPANDNEVVLKVKDLSKEGLFTDISFELKKGEVLGISGLMGSGRTEVVKTIFGAIKKDRGEIELNGKKVEINSPRDAIRHGIALLTEDRKTEGLVLNMEVTENISLTILDKLLKKGIIDKNEEENIAINMVNDLNIHPPALDRAVKTLSGGNQQKVVLAKWLAKNCDILILDEPTRGIDVGAKKEIYTIINELVKQGKSIIMVSSELPEVIGMSDRVIVMHDGRINKILNKDELSETNIMRYAVNKIAI